jgi:hypothetical protein
MYNCNKIGNIYGILGDPQFDEWHRRDNGDLSVGLNAYYSNPLPRSGSFYRMFYEDVIEPGNAYLNRNTNPPIFPMALLTRDQKNRVMNQYDKLLPDPVHLNIEPWGQRLRENTYSNGGAFSDLSVSYWENPWDIYLYDKTYADWARDRNCIANSEMMQRRWFS